ncbi:MAG: class I SAM-dependent methyltransferase [Phycisphaeraceae bacterium]|nr:class I SAM-dependent methyltransferase [Phycisphaeraceae bacterium]
MNLPDLFTPQQRALLDDLRARDRRERDAGIRNDMSLKALAPAVAQLVHFLIVQKRARTIVEFGTSHGYSTIHLAHAASITAGHVHSVESIAEKSALAAENLRLAGLSDFVTLTTADGLDFARTLPTGIDFVLVDYGIRPFAPALDILRDRMSPGCLIFIDGGPGDYWQTPDVRPFKHRLEADPDFLVTILPMHKDQLLAVKSR